MKVVPEKSRHFRGSSPCISPLNPDREAAMSENRLLSWRHLRWTLAGATCIFLVFALPSLMRSAYSPGVGGEGARILVHVLQGGLMLLAIGTILTAVFLLFAKTKRPRGIRLLLFGIVLGALTIQGMGLANKAENEAFERFAAETEPLIVAIKAYERQHGVPPERLEQLVPAFLPAIPDAGLSAAPRWRYSQNRQADGSTEWRLAVVVAMLGEIIYVPDPGCGSRGAKVTGGTWCYWPW